MEGKMIYVPYGDFVDGVMARADLDSIRAVIKNGSAYCSEEIRAILGLPAEKRRKSNHGKYTGGNHAAGREN